MLIKLPLGEERSGRLGSTIAARNRYGPYYRAGTIPVNPNTARQNTVRGIMQSLAITWANVLTRLQQDGWNEYGDNVEWRNKLGLSVNLAGQAHFIRSNAPRLQIGIARVDDAPVIFTLGIPELELVGSGSEATNQLSIAYDDQEPWSQEDGGAQAFYVGLPQNGSRRFFGGPYRFIGSVEGDSVTPPESPLATLDMPNWIIAENQRIWIRSRVMRADGRLSKFANHDFLASA